MKFHKPKDSFLNLFFIALSAVIAYVFTSIRFHNCGQYQKATLSNLLLGKADLPFQYRALLPWMVELARNMTKSLGLNLDPALTFKVFEFFSFSLLLVAYRRYLSLFFKNPLTSSVLALSLVLILPFNLLPLAGDIFYYPSDTPSLLFFTLGLILIYRKNWPLFYPLFILATLNRETSCFLTFIFLFTAWGKIPLLKILPQIFAQFVIWITIKYALWLIYGGNPGAGLFENQLRSNLALLMDPTTYQILLFSMGSIYLPVVIGYRLIPDDFVRRSVLVLIPFAGGMLFVAQIVELRVWAELIPVVLTAFLILVDRWVKTRAGHKTENRAPV